MGWPKLLGGWNTAAQNARLLLPIVISIEAEKSETVLGLCGDVQVHRLFVSRRFMASGKSCESPRLSHRTPRRWIPDQVREGEGAQMTAQIPRLNAERTSPRTPMRGR